MICCILFIHYFTILYNKFNVSNSKSKSIKDLKKIIKSDTKSNNNTFIKKKKTFEKNQSKFWVCVYVCT